MLTKNVHGVSSVQSVQTNGLQLFQKKKSKQRDQIEIFHWKSDFFYTIR